MSCATHVSTTQTPSRVVTKLGWSPPETATLAVENISCCKVFQSSCSVLQCVAMRCGVLQSVAVSCTALQCVAVNAPPPGLLCSMLILNIICVCVCVCVRACECTRV